MRAVGERRARRLTIGLAAAILLATLLGGGGLLWVTGERRARSARSSRAVGQALADGRELLAAARSAPVALLEPWNAALAAARGAHDLAASDAPEEDRRATAELLSLVQGEHRAATGRQQAWKQDQAMQGRLQTIRSRRGEGADLRETDAAYAAAFQAHGLDPATGHVDGRAIAGSGIAADLVAALDEWAWVRRRLGGADDPLATTLYELATAADSDAVRAAVRTAARSSSSEDLDRLASGPLSPESAGLLGRHLALAGDAEGAVRVLCPAWRTRPDDFWLAFELAEALTLLAEPAWKEAIAYYRAALAANPASRGAWERLAVALRRGGELEEAAALWHHALTVEPDDLTPYRHLVELHAERGDLDAAIAEFEGDALTSRSDPRPFVGIGHAFSLRGDWERAVPLFEQALVFAPGDPAIRRYLTEALLWSGRVERARATIDAVLEDYPEDAAAWEMLHRVLAVSDDPEAALEAVRRAAEIEPETTLYVFGVASALHCLGKLDEAQQVGERLVAMAPYEPLAHGVLGAVLLATGETEQALERLEHAVQLIRDGLEAAPWGITAIGVYDREVQEYRYRYVPGWDPNMGPARLQMAQARTRLGDLDGALAALDVLPWRAEFGIAADWLRQRIYMRTGRHAEALPLLLRIAQDPTAGAEIHLRLGHCLLAAGRQQEGRQALMDSYASIPWPPYWHYPESAWAADVETTLAFTAALPAADDVLDLRATPHERVIQALHCDAIGRHLDALRLYRSAFAVDPSTARSSLPWPLPFPSAFAAAQSALEVGCAVSTDAETLDETQRTALRREALEWMRSALDTLVSSARGTPDPGNTRLLVVAGMWPTMDELAAVHEERSLQALPAEEAQAWRAFWEQVMRAVEKAGG